MDGFADWVRIVSAAVLAALVESLAMLESDARKAFDGLKPMSDEDFAIAWNDEEPGPYARYVALLAISKAASPNQYRFENVGCSSCGEAFGPGDAGYSHCRGHKGLRAVR